MIRLSYLLALYALFVIQTDAQDNTNFIALLSYLRNTTDLDQFADFLGNFQSPAMILYEL